MGLFDFITNIFTRQKADKPLQNKSLKSQAAKNTKTVRKSSSSTDIDLQAGKKKTQKRKKTKAVASAPINEEALGFSISLKLPDGHSQKRQAVRTSLDELKVYIHRLKKYFPVTDISATGLGFAFEKPRIKSGVTIKMDLYLGKKVKAKNLPCKVMRHNRGAVGCTFLQLDREQDDVIHEIVLIGQKKQAEKKSSKKDKKFKIPS